MAPRKLVRRGGRYLRVYDAEWADPMDTEPSKIHGGRWNPPGEFGALYLNADVAVAAANARRWFVGRIHQLSDLLPEALPRLLAMQVEPADHLDVVTDEGVAALGLPSPYPVGVGHDRTQPIAREAYRDGLPGVACKSAAEATPEAFVGEELAVFDAHVALLVRRGAGDYAFDRWYPTRE